ARGRRGQDHPDLAPLADAGPRDDPVRGDRSAGREDPGPEVDDPLPGGLRAPRPRHPRGGRAGAVVLEPLAVRVQEGAPADLPAGPHLMGRSPLRVLAALALALLATTTPAQEKPPAAPAIPVPEIVGRADEVMAILRSLDRLLAPSPEIAAIDRQLSA